MACERPSRLQTHSMKSMCGHARIVWMQPRLQIAGEKLSEGQATPRGLLANKPTASECGRRRSSSGRVLRDLPNVGGPGHGCPVGVRKPVGFRHTGAGPLRRSKVAPTVFEPSFVRRGG